MLSQGNYSKEMVFPKRETAVPKRSIIFQLLASYAGAVLTFHFQLLVQTPVASSALTTGVAWLLLLALHENRRSLISAVYCGSFAGMSMLSASSAEAAGVLFQQAAGFSLAVALCYVLMESLTLYFPKVTFLGYGGRLGTTAFFSSLLCSLLLREDTAIISLNPIAAFPETHVSEMTYAVIACGGAIIPCLLLGKRWRTIDMYDLTGLTALLSLSASLLCKLFFEDLSLAPAAFYTGLFVSMTRPHLCGPPKLAIAGAVSGLLMLYFTHVFNGIGGSQGLAAMLAVASVTTFDSCLPARPVRKALVAVLTMAFVCLAASSIDPMSSGDRDGNAIALAASADPRSKSDHDGNAIALAASADPMPSSDRDGNAITLPLSADPMSSSDRGVNAIAATSGGEWQTGTAIVHGRLDSGDSGPARHQSARRSGRRRGEPAPGHGTGVLAFLFGYQTGRP